MHRKPSRISRRTKILVFLSAIAMTVLGFGLTASASTPHPPSVGQDAAGNYHDCVNQSSPYQVMRGNAADKCWAGWLPRDLAGVGTVIPAIKSVTATTNVTDWPESSGWATDAFTRAVTVTGATTEVDTNSCSGAAHCWFYTFQIVDNGGFKTVDGKPVPNGTGGTISGVFAGTMQGVASGSFYADSNALAATNVPTAASGDAKPASTTKWATLVLPGSAHTFGAKLTAYSWTYTAPTTCEQWVDAVNPGDDGQSAADGNITGTVHCTK